MGMLSVLIAAGSLAIATPARAAAIFDGDQLGFGGDVRFSTTTGILDFFEEGVGFGSPGGSANVLSGSAAAFGGSGNAISVKDITLNFDAGTNTYKLLSKVPDFLVLQNGTRFNLNTFDLTLRNSDWLASITGRLFDTEGGELPAIGTFDPVQDVAFTKVNGSSFYSGDVTAVPTPALLPGLVGIGLTAVRKRKKQGSEEEEA